MKVVLKRLLALTAGIAALAAQAQTPGPTGGGIAYPARNQSAQQQERDRFECFEWARAQSGFDPTQWSGAIAPAASAPSGTSAGSLRGTTGSMAGGAIGGAAIGELTKGDAGRSAAIGALGAGAVHRIKEQQAAQQRQAQAGQMQAGQAAQQSQQPYQRTQYQRALAACMEGRGYVLK